MKRIERMPYDLKGIIHIRGVDHPESISVGPSGEAYTTGTGGQVYRLDLQNNTAQQFASVAPRRILGQAVDAHGNLYCADTSLGQVIRIAPDGTETTYAQVPDGLRCANYPAFDHSGNLFLSDSGDWSDEINGGLFRISPEDREAVRWYADPLDTPNAIAFDADERFLYFVETFHPAIARIGINADGSAAKLERVLPMPRHVPDGIAFDEDGQLWIACHRPDAIYVFDPESHRLQLFCEDWMGHRLRGPTDVAFAGVDRNILLAASLDNLVVHRFDNVGTHGLKLNHPEI